MEAERSTRTLITSDGHGGPPVCRGKIVFLGAMPSCGVNVKS